MITYFVLILVAAYILTPRFWEPASETYRSWAAARILKETGGFPVFSLSPGYVVYLLIFRIFDHPFSLHLEYFITHIFTYTVIFLMLVRLLPPFFAFLLTCAWIPHLAILEGTATVAAIGFFALYIYSSLGGSLEKREEYLPNSLLAASLCHLAYLPFLLGNLIGVFLKKRLTNLPLFHFSSNICWKKVPSLAAKALLLSIIVLTVLFQSKRWDNNHMFIDEKYAPISLKSGLKVAFFGYSTIIYMNETMPDKGIGKDWYFGKKEVWGDVSNIIEGIIKRPKLIMMVLRANFRYFLQMPKHLFSESDFRNPYGMALTLICFFLFILGIAGFFLTFKINTPSPFAFSIAFGSSATIMTLMLTAFSRRYIPVLLPVWFLILVYSGKELWRLAKYIYKDIPGRLNFTRDVLFVLIFLGAILNKVTLSFLFHQALPVKVAMFVWFLDLLLIVGMTICIIFLVRHLHSLNPTVPPYSCILVVCFSAFFLFLTAKYPYGWTGQVKALLSSQGLLVKKQAVSMESVYSLFAKNINSQTRIIALEDIWIKAFTKADLDRVYSIFSLPPFPDPSGQTQKLLGSLDEIWVSTDMSRPEPVYLTQVFLRYQLHIEPFLQKAITNDDWVVQEIEGFGKRYRKIKE